MKLKEFKEVRGTIKCLTGMKIGGTKDAVGIGETDNPIIRHPISRLPYIPGSSLKGKTRSLLEMKYAEDSQRTGRPTQDQDSSIARLYGNGNPSRSTEPTRLIFRDAFLAPDSKKWLQESLPGSFVEVKSEIAMNRREGKTQRGSLREQERVPEATVFELDMTVRLFEEDDNRRREYFDRLAEAFEMLEKDYLGGNGTRGYGQVEINHEDGGSLADYLRKLQ